MVRSSLVLAVAACALLAAPAGAASHPTCPAAAKARGMTAVARGAKASVYRTARYEYYACVAREGRLRHVRTCCQEATWRVRGLWAAYVGSGSAIGDEFHKVAVVNLRTGRERVVRKEDPNAEGGAGGEIDTASFVKRLVLSTTGAIAWTQPTRHADGTLGPEVELRAVAGATPWERIVDRGAVAPGSLRLAEGWITWTRTGVARSTDLSQGTFRGRCASGVKGTIVRSEPGFVIFRVRSTAREFRGWDYYGCANPNGHVFPLGSDGAYDAGIAQRSVGFGKWAGTFVVVRESYGSETAQTSGGDVVDLTTGVRNTAWYLQVDDSGQSGAGLAQEGPRSSVLTPTGLFAGIFPTPEGDGEIVGAVSPAGAATTLDTAAAKGTLGGLAIDGTTVSWTNAGAAKSATVPAD